MKDPLYANVIGFQLAGMKSMRLAWQPDKAGKQKTDVPFAPS
ncbi:hypothetical protein IMCC9480_1840 [Oxalobacteraceae bacterium IMCC9480]|nr:hypothetical protein IMCC9480_1840 [Oxalobacteraceae bacterium IMCC9480]